MSMEDNRALIRKWLAAWIAGDLHALDGIFAADYSVNNNLLGIDGVKRAARSLHSAFTGISIEINDLIAEGDQVVARWTLRGLHAGPLLGVPPTAKQVELHGINIYRIAHGKIASNYEETNIPEVIHRLRSSPGVTGP